MSHELTQNMNGEVEFFYAGKKPWHGLGQKLDKPATAEEAITAAHLDWEVSNRELITVDGVDVPNHRAIVRNDNSKVLSVMSKNYEPVQNTDAFAFFDSVIGTGGAYYETAGSIFEGKRIFLVAKLPKEIIAGKDDKIEQYLTLVNSHDGSTALRMYFTPIRVVCNNTLIASLGRQTESVSIRHIGNVTSKIQYAQDALGLAHRYYSDFEAIVERLHQISTTKKMVDEVCNEVFKVDKEKGETGQQQKAIDCVINDFENDPKNNLEGMQRTAWSLYNAVCQYADHESRSVSKDANRRMSSIMFTTAAKLKQTALDSILSLS